mmetsp:Transcript_12291/g.35529  ORF Transcript_12291/g.35529 Transcript_12291/m.35529 type:complete len:83 (-) Transcript_12291:578-826(-)
MIWQKIVIFAELPPPKELVHVLELAVMVVTAVLLAQIRKCGICEALLAHTPMAVGRWDDIGNVIEKSAVSRQQPTAPPYLRL